MDFDKIASVYLESKGPFLDFERMIYYTVPWLIFQYLYESFIATDGTWFRGKPVIPFITTR